MSPQTARRLVVLFRYSEGRDAYVLRGVGNVIGPVLQIRAEHMSTPPSMPAPDL